MNIYLFMKLFRDYINYNWHDYYQGSDQYIIKLFDKLQYCDDKNIHLTV